MVRSRKTSAEEETCPAVWSRHDGDGMPLLMCSVGEHFAGGCNSVVTMRSLVLLASLAGCASAQLPEIYTQVDRIVFVVPDVDKAVAAWKTSGAVEIFGKQTAEFEAEYRGRTSSSSVYFAAGRFGDVIANWMQPVSGNNAFADFLKTHGPGVFALLHRVPSRSELDAEVARMKSLDVAVLQTGPMGDDDSRYALFDTRREGKYTLGIYYQQQSPPPAPASARKVTQFAFIVHDEKPVAKYWARLGWPDMSITRPELNALDYRGKPGDFKARLGWMRHGRVAYEWIMPEKGPSSWQDHLDKHGEGIHHLAFNVDDMDRSIRDWKQNGFDVAMSGGWGEPGKKGSGRFAYIDTQAASGLDVELLWNQR